MSRIANLGSKELSDLCGDNYAARYSAIHRVDMAFRSGKRLVACSSANSFQVFRRLERAVENGEELVYLAQAGRSLAPASLDGLACYLRNRGLRGFFRVTGTSGHRYAWQAFCDHLALRFL